MAASADAVGIAAPGIHAASEAKASISWKPLKLGFGVTLLLAGAFGILSDQRYLNSRNAVVTAYVVLLRSPIEGDINQMELTEGLAVSRGESLVHIQNPFADDRRLLDEQSQVSQMQASASGAKSERELLLQEENELQERARVHSRAVSERLTHQGAEAEELVAERQAELTEASTEENRESQLLALGVVARAEFDKIASARAVAQTKVDQAKNELAALDDEVSFARKGILTEPGTNNDVSYSQQRADEVTLRLAENLRVLETMKYGAVGAATDSAGQADYLRRISESTLNSPINGIVWKLTSVEGERVAAGDSIAQLIDCHHAFVLVNFPQERMMDITMGAPARVRLTGEANERTGKVTSITGESKDADEPKLAAQPFKNPNDHVAVVRIEYPIFTQDSCMVGRTAEVLIRSRGSSAVGRWVRDHF